MLQFRGSVITSDTPRIATTRYRPYVSLTIALLAGFLANIRGGERTPDGTRSIARFPTLRPVNRVDPTLSEWSCR
jgi:hypothetical protein